MVELRGAAGNCIKAFLTSTGCGRLAHDFPELSFTLNGGISGAKHVVQALQAHQQLHGVMAGRWVLQRPLDLACMDTLLPDPRRWVKFVSMVRRPEHTRCQSTHTRTQTR